MQKTFFTYDPFNKMFYHTSLNSLPQSSTSSQSNNITQVWSHSSYFDCLKALLLISYNIFITFRSDHTCLLVLVTKNSLFKNSTTFMSLNYWVKQVKCLSSLCLWHLMRRSLHCDKNKSWVELLEAGMLWIREPRIAIYKDLY